MSSGLVPSITAVITDPDSVCVRSSRSSSDGLAISFNPASSMRNRPISSTGPNRFFSERRMRSVSERSPSITKSASIRCSRVFGPAMDPSLFTCPMRKIGILFCFAA